MKVLHLVTLGVILLVLPSGAAIGQVKHPNLLFNRQEIAEMKAKIDKYPWARQTFERIKADAEADADGGNPYKIPTRVATAMMYVADGRPEVCQGGPRARRRAIEGPPGQGLPVAVEPRGAGSHHVRSGLRHLQRNPAAGD